MKNIFKTLKNSSDLFIIAEAGSNWKRGTYREDLAQAKKLIKTASICGADAIKFQTYDANVYVQHAGKSNYLSKKGIGTAIHYPIPIHLQRASRKYGYKVNDFPFAEKQSKRILTLPINQYLTKKQIIYICDSINKFYRK